MNIEPGTESVAAPLFLKVDCHSLPVQDLDAAIAFYAELGHRLIWREGNHAAGLRLPATDAEIVLHTDPRPVETCFLVRSVPEAVERFLHAGGKLQMGPIEIAVGRYALLRDPWDNPLAILDFSKGLLKTDSAGNVIGNLEPDPGSPALE